jgi:hypothetical protein
MSARLLSGGIVIDDDDLVIRIRLPKEMIQASGDDVFAIQIQDDDADQRRGPG